MTEEFQMETLTERTITKTCRECGQSFSMDYPAFAKFVEVCPACSERHAEQDQRELLLRSATMRAEAWRRICPPGFMDTQPHKLPRPSLLQKVLAWEYGPRGLLLHGETGRGKSRCVWALLKREHQAGRSVRALDAKAAYDYGALFAKSCEVANEWLERLITADVLLLDDVFKSRLTDSFEQALFVLVTQRTERHRPLIVTCNDVGDFLLSRMSADRGVALVRRLREYTNQISVT
ncbi:MAG: ATP-binding protein [Verrucomicrobia bacterium]|nr:ATP-binding protein [Verrucomicrobiota bacterium]